MHMTIDAGKVAHNAMAWREGSVLGQATWPPFSDQGQVLALKGLHPKKKTTCWEKGTPQERWLWAVPWKQEMNEYYKRGLPEAYCPYLKEGIVRQLPPMYFMKGLGYGCLPK